MENPEGDSKLRKGTVCFIIPHTVKDQARLTFHLNWLSSADRNISQPFMVISVSTTI